ncbi:MAG: hypothetical protein REI78_01825 [Pedobacter sp.]|nr:hypothetical protein [Pedobacter sp.]
MELKAPILQILNKNYPPDQVVQTTFKKYDLVFKTDTEGNPILLFLGQMQSNGHIRGERYARRLVRDQSGQIIKDHWDHKGKATP